MTSLEHPPSCTASPWTGDVAQVFEHEPDLLRDLDERSAGVLRQRAIVRVLRLEPGVWAPTAPFRREAPPGWLGLLVLRGLLTRSVDVEGRLYPELLGAGDLLRPWPAGDLADAPRWKILVPTSLAVLDDRFAAVMGRFPQVFARLMERMAARNQGLVFHLALANVRRADPRLLMLFHHLADRWGRMTPEGIVLPLPLTHELLAHLASIRRPTATVSLHRLMDAGKLDRRSNGWWVLPHAPRHEPVADTRSLVAA